MMIVFFIIVCFDRTKLERVFVFQNTGTRQRMGGLRQRWADLNFRGEGLNLGMVRRFTSIEEFIALCRENTLPLERKKSSKFSNNSRSGK